MRSAHRVHRVAVLFGSAFVVAILFAPHFAAAHGMRSVLVEIREYEAGRATIAVKAQVPVTGVRISADPPCTVGDSSLTCPGGIAGARLRIDGLGVIVSEAAVATTFADGTSVTQLVTPSRPAWEVPQAHVSWTSISRQYVGLGVEHILAGGDHLLFLLGLVLVLRRTRAVLIAETAFTLSHTVTFGASALGWVRVPSLPVEALIAASLVLVALEVGPTEKAEKTNLRNAVALAFVFGLVHGLGFAGGLAEIGLPDRAIPAALAGFAAGVELGQVAFLAAVLLLFWLVRRAPSLERHVSRAAVYLVGGVGSFWFLERVRALIPIH